MKSRSTNTVSTHYFFLLFAAIQLLAAVWVYIKDGFSFSLESVLVTSTDIDVSFLTIYLGLLGIAYALLLCAVLVVAAHNLSKS